jgi:poly [ADP-ribose] polymerase
LTNWVGILSQGLRIAPPEAPKTGYRFGKGVYFADIISKSASYCFANPQRPVGFMILNEVALGNINKVTRDTYMEKAPNGFHSTMALGHTAPNPKGNYIT